MCVDVTAAHRVIADLLTDEKQRHAWQADPTGYAGRRLEGKAEAGAVAGLDWQGVSEAASHLRVKSNGRAAFAQRLEDRTHRPPSVALHNGEHPRLRPRQPSRPLVGLGYRPGLFRRFFPHLGLVEVWEHTVDHYIHGGDGALGAMEVFACGPPLALHSLDLSVGSPEAKADPDRLERVRKVAAVAGVSEISDHLGFTRIGPHAMDHFAPLWLVPETLDLVAENVEFLQDRLGVRLALENITLSFDPGGDMTTAEFLTALTARTGCGVHLDITNLTINAANGYCNAADELAALDLDSVVGVHLAGGIEAGGKMRDAHSFPVPEGDLVWLERLLPDMPNCRTIVIERDGRHQAEGEVAEDLRRIRAVVSSATEPAHVPA